MELELTISGMLLGSKSSQTLNKGLIPINKPNLKVQGDLFEGGSIIEEESLLF